MNANQQPNAPFQSASLYVGDLHNDVTESLLFEHFNTVGPVASIRVCRDSITRRSLGYAYVNFHHVQDAERALDTMNFIDIKNRPCRIMWSQRDPSLRKSGVGNVFVRNLSTTVDNKGLYDTFSVFGNILSCKVATDENGASKGYGYVHFETAEAAQDAISKFNGTLIDDVEVHVGSFVRRKDRAGQADWTNLYVKQFPTSWDETKLKELFEPFGTVLNVVISMDDEGKSKGFGFVNYSAHEDAVKAIEGLANKTFTEDGKEVKKEDKEETTADAAAADANDGAEKEKGEETKKDGASEEAVTTTGAEPSDKPKTFELYVSRAQKKNERNREIKSHLDTMNQERVSKYQGMNLYVKNISDTVTDELFRETFAPFGTITSARVMRDANSEGNSTRGFGFVCFSSPEEATRAVQELNGKNVGGKPLVVTLHQRKEHRRMHLNATYGPGQNPRVGAGGFMQGIGGPAGGMVPSFMSGMYPGNFPAGAVAMQPPQGGPGGPRGVPGFTYPAGGAGNAPMGSRGGGPRNMQYGAPRPSYYNVQQQQPPFMQGSNAGGPGAPGPGQFNKQGRGGPNQAGGFAGGMPGQHQGGRGAGGRGAGGRGAGGPMAGGAGFAPPNQQQMQQQMGGAPNQQMRGQQQQQLKFSNQARNQSGGQIMAGGQMPGQQQQPGTNQQQQQLAAAVQMQMQMQHQLAQQQAAAQQQPVLPGNSEIMEAILSASDPLTQKNLIGELLYPLISKHQPELAGKITGMLLEMDNSELINLSESPDALMSKIEEALVVLRNHKGDE